MVMRPKLYGEKEGFPLETIACGQMPWPLQFKYFRGDAVKSAASHHPLRFGRKGAESGHAVA